MTDQPVQESGESLKARLRRQAAMDEIFGEVLPGESRSAATRSDDSGERWLLENRPPHHDPE